MHEKTIFEKLFNRNGYVLDFTDSTFAEFFREHGIDIEDNKYHINGRSKMKRLRAFWEIEPDKTVGQVLKSLLEYAYTIDSVSPNANAKDNAMKIVLRLLQKENREQITEQELKDIFLKQKFKDISIEKLNLNTEMQEVIKMRIEEIKKCLRSKAPLATIFLCGSTLEGILLSVAENHADKFKAITISPKDRNQKWTLSDLIDVSKEIGLLNEDVKKFSHSLRKFRNYIHPYQQAVEEFNPDEHTAKICWQVLKLAIFQISKKNSE